MSDQTTFPPVDGPTATALALLVEAAREALPVVEFVSRGRGYVGVEPYPDARARNANALLRDALEDPNVSGWVAAFDRSAEP